MQEQDFKIYSFYEQLLALINKSQLNPGTIQMILTIVQKDVQQLYVENINYFMHNHKIVEEREIPFNGTIGIDPITGKIEESQQEIKLQADDPKLQKQATNVNFTTLDQLSGQK